jgi:hypothetical protein
VERRVVAAVVLVEALVVAGYAVFLAFETIVAPATDRLAAVFLVVVAALIAVGLSVLGRAVVRGARGARAPVLVWQVLQASVAGPALSQRWYVAVPLLLLCVVAAVGVFRPGVIVDPE